MLTSWSVIPLHAVNQSSLSWMKCAGCQDVILPMTNLISPGCCKKEFPAVNIPYVILASMVNYRASLHSDWHIFHYNRMLVSVYTSDKNMFPLLILAVYIHANSLLLFAQTGFPSGISLAEVVNHPDLGLGYVWKKLVRMTCCLTKSKVFIVVSNSHTRRWVKSWLS